MMDILMNQWKVTVDHLKNFIDVTIKIRTKSP